jgi:antitoxin component of RelBE/YafQ-DinJ toxin-antitoxin module
VWAEIGRMTTPLAHDARIDLRIPSRWRKELDQLADEVGLSATDVCRLGLRYLLNHRDRLVKMMDHKE